MDVVKGHLKVIFQNKIHVVVVMMLFIEIPASPIPYNLYQKNTMKFNYISVNMFSYICN